MTDHVRSLPKMLTGSLHLEFKKCGRSNCRCQRGALHGPYFYHHWREGGRQKKHYVPRSAVVPALIAIARHKQLLPSTTAMRSLLNN